jgi:hypothetical protein
MASALLPADDCGRSLGPSRRDESSFRHSIIASTVPAQALDAKSPA